MIRETAITAFAIVGLMYIFQEHSIEIKQNEELIKRGRIQQSILESNLTLLTEKEKTLSNKNIKLLSNIESINSKHKAKIENFNQILVKKNEFIKKESEKASKQLIEAQEITHKIQSQLDTKEKEITKLLSKQSNLEENLTTQIEQNNLLLEEKEKIEKRISELLTVDKIKNFDSLLTQIDNLEINLTAKVEKNQNLQEIIDNASATHEKDIEEYQVLLSQYKVLESNLTSEIQKEINLTDEKVQLESNLDSEVQNKKDLELKLAEEIENENRIKEELAKELEKEEALSADLNKTTQENILLVDNDKKIEFEMSELLFISKDSREKAEAEHQKKIKELDLQLAMEIEKEQNLEANLTAEIERENILKEKNGELEAKLVEQIREAKEDKKSALSDSKIKIDELNATLVQEIEKGKNLESNLSVELEKENALLDEKGILETKISEQLTIFEQKSQEVNATHNQEIKEIQKRLDTELQNKEMLESNLTTELEREKLLVEEKIGLESNITALLSTIETKNQEIDTKEELRAKALAEIEKLTKKRDELEKLKKENESQLAIEKEATKTALLEVEKVKKEMKDVLDKIAEEKKAEEERVAKEKKIAKENLLEAFKLTTVEFEINSMKLTKKSEELLNTTAEVMKKYPNFSYNIQGHTDNRGNEEFNIKLSGKRAEQVKKYLISRGIRAEILSTEGIGSAQPIADNETEEGRILNRRVVFQIVKE